MKKVVIISSIVAAMVAIAAFILTSQDSQFSPDDYLD